MKFWLLLACPLASTVMAAVLPEVIPEVSIAGFGHYATYVDSETGYTFNLHAQGYAGAPVAIMINSSASVPQQQFRNPQSGAVQKVEERDICDKIVACYNVGSDTAVTASLFIANTVGGVCLSLYSGWLNYFTVNDYANLNTVIQGTVVGLFVNIVSTPIGDAILNSLHRKTAAASTSDACGIAAKDVLAQDFAGAIYQFCTSIQAAKDVTTFTDYIAGDVSDSSSTTDLGEMSMTKAFVAAQAGNWGPTCAALGITWKRWMSLDPWAGAMSMI